MNALLLVSRMVNFTSTTDILSGVNIEYSLKIEKMGKKYLFTPKAKQLEFLHL